VEKHFGLLAKGYTPLDVALKKAGEAREEGVKTQHAMAVMLLDVVRDASQHPERLPAATASCCWWCWCCCCWCHCTHHSGPTSASAGARQCPNQTVV